MVQWKKNLLTLSIATFAANVAFTMYAPFIPTYLVELGVKDNLALWSGIMVSGNLLPYALIAPIWGSLSDRYGKKLMFWRSGLGIAAAMILQGLVSNHWQLLFVRAFNGLLSGFIPVAIMLIASNTPQAEMGYALGIINTFIALGAILGPFVGGLLMQYFNVPVLLFISAGLISFSTVLAVAGTREKIIAQTEKTSLKRNFGTVLHNPALLVFFACMTILQLSMSMVQPILPLRVAELTTTNVDFLTGLIFSVVGVSLAIGSLLMGRIKNVSYIMVLSSGLILCGFFNISQGLTYSVFLLIAERFFFGFAYAAVNVSGNVLITEYTGEEIRGRIFGALSGVTAIGWAVGPLLGGMMGETLGNASAFFGAAFFFFLAAYLVWRLKKQIKSGTAGGLFKGSAS